MSILNILIHWLPGIALLIMAGNIWGPLLFESFPIMMFVCVICVVIDICWLCFSSFVFSCVRNITWRYYGYKDLFYLLFPFVYSKGNGFHLLSTTLTYNSLLFDSIPEDFIMDQVDEYRIERNKICAISERNAIIAFVILNLILVNLLFIDCSWVLVVATIWLRSFFLCIVDINEYKGLYTKYIDYKSNKVIFYLAKSAAYQGKLTGNLRKELFSQVESNEEYKRFEFYLYKSLKVQCMHMAVRGGIDNELFDYVENKSAIHDVNIITNATGQERLECLKILADSAVLNDNHEQKQILYKDFIEMDINFVQNIGKTLFGIWEKMLRDEIVEEEINHKFDQTKQILSDSDIYNRKIYRVYDDTWKQLHECLRSKIKKSKVIN